jgi:hypothetical protein
MEKSATVGQIWDASKTYTSSNTVKRYDAIIDAKSVQELGTYARTHLLEQLEYQWMKRLTTDCKNTQ